MTRIATQDVKLYDGTLVPEGTYIAVAEYPTHRDEVNYPDPDTFDPFRFSHLREDGKGSLRYQATSTSANYVPFGHGQNAW